MSEILDDPWEQFGGIPIVVSGDFAQLSSVGGRPLYKTEHSVVWKEYLNVFLELRTNHRFDKDGSAHNQYSSDSDAVYATKTNVGRMAINDAILATHLKNTHSTDPGILPPMHTLCMKAGNLRFHVGGTRREFSIMKKKAQEVIHAAVRGSSCVRPMQQVS